MTTPQVGQVPGVAISRVGLRTLSNNIKLWDLRKGSGENPWIDNCGGIES